LIAALTDIKFHFRADFSFTFMTGVLLSCGGSQASKCLKKYFDKNKKNDNLLLKVL